MVRSGYVMFSVDVRCAAAEVAGHNQHNSLPERDIPFILT